MRKPNALVTCSWINTAYIPARIKWCNGVGYFPKAVPRDYLPIGNFQKVMLGLLRPSRLKWDRALRLGEAAGGASAATKAVAA